MLEVQQPILSIQELSIDFRAPHNLVHAVRNVSLDVQRNEVLALIGESGSGKSTLAQSIVRLLPRNAVVRKGALIYRSNHISVNGPPGVEEIDLLKLSKSALNRFRWKECSMVFQSSLDAMNPLLTIADQFVDTAQAHGHPLGTTLERHAADLFSLVRLDPRRVWHAYPHELSDGQRQRVLIALSLLLDPKLLILDEPTSAVDLLNQRILIDVLKDLRRQLYFSCLLISHDLALAMELGDRVATMYGGQIVELSDPLTFFKASAHPYTIGLIQACPSPTETSIPMTPIRGLPPNPGQLPSGCKFHPRCPFADLHCQHDEPGLAEIQAGHFVACWNWSVVYQNNANDVGNQKKGVDPQTVGLQTRLENRTYQEKADSRPLVELDHVTRMFLSQGESIKAVDDISLTIAESEIICLVGESGCGKTTTARMITNLLQPSSGRILFRGQDIAKLKGSDFKHYRLSVQMIHQNVDAALNPANRIYDILAAPLRQHQVAKTTADVHWQVGRLLEQVGLTPPDEIWDRYPHQLSGGQRQRVVIARALTVKPALLIADEAISLVDASTRINLLKLLIQVKAESQMAILFITHDLAIAHYFAQQGRIGVMYLGQLIELASARQILVHPQHPYTQALFSAILDIDPEKARRKSRINLPNLDVPNLLHRPPGCAFHPRCQHFAGELCQSVVPELTRFRDGSAVACHPVKQEREQEIILE